MYQLSRPTQALQTAIESYWFVQGKPGETLDLTVDVYVDLRADLVFNFGVPYQRTALGTGPFRTSCLLKEANLDAQRLYPIQICQKGDVDIVGVRFHVAGLSPFVDAPVHRWNNQVVPVEEVLGTEVEEFRKELQTKATIEEKTNLLDRYFLARMRTGPGFNLLLGLKSRIEVESGLCRMGDLCKEFGLSIRKLDRLFHQHLGFSPKVYARVVRFQRALTLLKTDPGCTLAEVAALCGYYDQPHFVREFKDFAGSLPKAQIGYFPKDAPQDFSPNLVQFVQDGKGASGPTFARTTARATKEAGP